MPRIFDREAAKRDGFTDAQIDAYLKTQNYQEPVRQPQPVAAPVVQPQPQTQVGGEGEGFLDSLTKPFRVLGEGGVSMLRLLGDATGIKKITGDEKPVFLKEKEVNKIVENPVKGAAQTAAGLASWVIPAGKAASLTKAVGQSALAGGLGAYGNGAESVEEIATGAITGGTIGAVAKGAGAAAGALKRGAAGGAESAGKTLAVKGLRPPPSQQATFFKETGEKLDEFLLKRNLGGSGFEGITKYIDPLQKQFDDIAENANLLIDPNNILDRTIREVDRLNSSVLPTDKNKAQALQNLVSNFIEQYGDQPLTAKAVTALRRDIDKGIKDFAPDPTVKGPVNLFRDVLQNSIRESADEAGINVAGKSLKEIGEELSKSYKLLEIAEKQQFLGQGSVPASLTNLLGGNIAATAGSALGLPTLPAAAVGMVGTSVMNNPRVVQKAASGLTKLSEGVNNFPGAGKVGEAGTRVARQAGSVLPVSGTENGVNNVFPVMGNEGENEHTNNETDPSRHETIIDPSVNSELLPPPTEEGLPPLLTKEQMAMVMLQDLAETGGKNIPELNSIFELIKPEEGQKKKLASGQQKELSDIQNSINAVTDLGKVMVENKDLFGPVKGMRNLNPYDSQAKSLESQLRTVRQMVGEAMEGGVLRKEDEEKYKKMLPEATDTYEVAVSKLNNVLSILQNQFATKEQTYNQYDVAGSDSGYLPPTELNPLGY